MPFDIARSRAGWSQRPYLHRRLRRNLSATPPIPSIANVSAWSLKSLLPHTADCIPIVVGTARVRTAGLTQRGAKALNAPGRHFHTTSRDAPRGDAPGPLVPRAFLGNHRPATQH